MLKKTFKTLRSEITFLMDLYTLGLWKRIIQIKSFISQALRMSAQ